MSTFDDDVLAQPAVLARLLGRWERQVGARERLRAFPPDAPVVLTGVGASLAAVSIAESALRAAGRLVVTLDAGELALYGIDGVPRDSIVVAASQTGLSRETTAVARALGDRVVSVVGIVNDPVSPLASLVDVCIAIDAGPEDSNASKTFTATQLLALLVAGELVHGGAGPGIPDGLAHTVASLTSDAAIADQPASALGGCPAFTFLAHGPALSTARYGALLTKEMLALPGEALTVSEFRHGPLELVARDVGVIIMAPMGPGRDVACELAASVATRGGRVWLLATPGRDVPARPGIVVTELGALGEPEWAIAAAVPVQRFLSRLTRELGRTPGVFAVFDPSVDTGRAAHRAGQA